MKCSLMGCVYHSNAWSATLFYLGSMSPVLENTDTMMGF